MSEPAVSESPAVGRGDELEVTLEARSGEPFWAKDVAGLIGNTDKLLRAIAHSIDPKKPIVTTVTRVDILDGRLRVTFRLVPGSRRTRR